MIPKPSYGDIVNIAQNGSPLLLQAVGRVFGLGPNERKALSGNGNGGGIPTWTWVAFALIGGFVAGVKVYRRWPKSVPKLISGK